MSATTDLDDDLSSEQPAAAADVHLVEFTCPACGDDRSGVLVEHADGDAWVECDECGYRTDPGILDIPTEGMLIEWQEQALRHGQAALECADGSPACSSLATFWCRRLAPELSDFGKTAFLDTVTRPLDGALTRHQREVVLQFGVALRMSPTAINRFLDVV